MSYLLDTHILLKWASDPKSIGLAKQKALQEADALGLSIGISSITLWEIALLAERKRIQFHIPIKDWLHKIETNPKVAVFGVDANIAIDSYGLGEDFPKDPADRIIAATARIYGLTLMTDDKQIKQSKLVATI